MLEDLIFLFSPVRGFKKELREYAEKAFTIGRAKSVKPTPFESGIRYRTVEHPAELGSFPEPPSLTLGYAKSDEQRFMKEAVQKLQKIVEDHEHALKKRGWNVQVKTELGKKTDKTAQDLVKVLIRPAKGWREVNHFLKSIPLRPKERLQR